MKAVADKADAVEILRREMNEQLEAEKEKRVAHLQQQAMRRIANAGLASGFGAWQEQWEEAARQKRMLAAAGARLRRPALAASLSHWSNDWQYELKVLSSCYLVITPPSGQYELKVPSSGCNTR